MCSSGVCVVILEGGEEGIVVVSVVVGGVGAGGAVVGPTFLLPIASDISGRDKVLQ